jgi:cytochrome c
MKNSKIVWKRDALVKFITDPRKSVPGTRMAFAGIKDPKKAREVADYLLSLK